MQNYIGFSLGRPRGATSLAFLLAVPGGRKGKTPPIEHRTAHAADCISGNGSGADRSGRGNIVAWRSLDRRKRVGELRSLGYRVTLADVGRFYVLGIAASFGYECSNQKLSGRVKLRLGALNCQLCNFYCHGIFSLADLCIGYPRSKLE